MKRLGLVHANRAVVIVEAGGGSLAIRRRAAVGRLGATIVHGELLGAIGLAGALGCGQRTLRARRLRRPARLSRNSVSDRGRKSGLWAQRRLRRRGVVMMSSRG